MYNICFKSFTGCRTLLKRQGLRKIIDNKFSVYSKFWLRYANVPFSLDKYDIYEKHFTVMNYSAAAHLEQMFCDDFISKFEEQNPGSSGSSIQVQDDIFKMFRFDNLGW